MYKRQIQAIREVAAEVLPKGYGFEFDGITREEAQTGSNTAIIFGICILLIYLSLIHISMIRSINRSLATMPRNA